MIPVGITNETKTESETVITNGKRSLRWVLTWLLALRRKRSSTVLRFVNGASLHHFSGIRGNDRLIAYSLILPFAFKRFFNSTIG